MTMKLPKSVNSLLVKLKLKKESPLKKIVKKAKKILHSRRFWTTLIVGFSTLALVATSILPFLLS